MVRFSMSDMSHLTFLDTCMMLLNDRMLRYLHSPHCCLQQLLGNVWRLRILILTPGRPEWAQACSPVGKMGCMRGNIAADVWMCGAAGNCVIALVQA